MTLKEVLEQKAAQFQNNVPVIDEWKEAVDRLFNQLESWLNIADPNGYIEHERSRIEVTEPGFGRYTISRLNLRSFGKWVGIIPKARNTVKHSARQQNAAPEQATGRVDITDEIRRYVLYRFDQGNDEQWFIVDVAGTGQEERFTADRFEAALLSYFQ